MPRAKKTGKVIVRGKKRERAPDPVPEPVPEPVLEPVPEPVPEPAGPAPAPLRMAELFTGTGAFSLAFEGTARFQTVFANDFDENSQKIYDLNFDTPLTLKDLTDLNVKDIPKMDLLTGGFPCQPFSISGRREGFNDPRANVFWKIIEVIKEHKPRFVVLENVKNLTTHDNGNTFRTIEEALTGDPHPGDGVGYHIRHKVLNTYKVTDVPQNRERIFIVCFRDRADADRFQFPADINDHIEIKDLVDTEVADKYYYKETLKIWPTVSRDVVKDITTNTIYQYRRHYVRENKHNVCPTLTANMGEGGHNVPLLRDTKGIRKLTPRECFKLQGFPPTYQFPKISDSKLYKLAGNAVTVKVVARIAEELVKVLLSHDVPGRPPMVDRLVP